MLEDAGSGRRYNAFRMINFTLAVVGLRSLTDLSPIDLHLMRASLPDALAELAPTMLACVRMPSAATLHRYQLLVDAVLLNMQSEEPLPAMLCWMVDASPQAGADWLLTLQVGVGTADVLIAIMDAAHELTKAPANDRFQ